MKSGNKSSNTLGAVAFILLIVGGCFYFSWTLVPTYRQSKADIKGLEQESTEIEAKIQSLTAVQRDLADIDSITTKLFVAVPEDKGMPNLITELEATAAKSGIVLPTISVSDATAADNTAVATTGAAPDNVVKISIAISATFEKATEFIGALEKDIRFMNIKNISMSSAVSGTDTADSDKMSVSFELEAFKRAAVKAPVAEAAAVDGAAAAN